MAMQIEVRNDSVHISGYVNAVGRDSRKMYDDWGCPYVEQVMPGAFDKAIKRSQKIELKKNHEDVIGSTQEGNLILYEDNIGLYAECDVDDYEVVEAARAEKLRGWSFAFYEEKAHAESTTDPECRRRVLEEIDLLEVSILTNKTPAYFGTSIEARQNDGYTKKYRAVETDCCISKKAPKEDNSSKVSFDLQKRQIEILKLKGVKK